MMELYRSCMLCPRNCGVNRLAGEKGLCGEDSSLRIGAVLKHYGEEPPLVGATGSGTIFVSGCNLGCSFCQNYQISQDAGDGTKSALGRVVCVEEFAGICAALEDKDAVNINIVTGSHVIPSLIEGFTAARKAGVKIPILWNSSGYESTQALELLREHVDIYLPDLKTLDSEISAKYFNAPDYPQVAKDAILKMIEMTENKNVAEKIIIRHLILPGYLDSTKEVLRWFAENAAGKAQLSIMTQYTPIPNRQRQMPQTYLRIEEYETVLQWLKEFKIEDGFCQEFVTGSEWLPDFKRFSPFSSELSVPLWHFTSQT